MKDLERFIPGFRTFQKDYFGPEGTVQAAQAGTKPQNHDYRLFRLAG
jgi:hypothetical protein